jgi:hypothetical protein
VTLASQQQAGELLVKILSFKSTLERVVALPDGHSDRINGCAVMKNVENDIVNGLRTYRCTECMPDWVLSSGGACYQPDAGTDHPALSNALNCLFSRRNTCEACPVGLVLISNYDSDDDQNITVQSVMDYFSTLTVDGTYVSNRSVCADRAGLEQFILEEESQIGLVLSF